MKQWFLLFAATLLCVPLVTAQISLVSSNPASGTVNVPLTGIMSVTFSQPLDTTKHFTEKGSMLSNVDTVFAEWSSTDRMTRYFSVQLQPNKAYFVCFFYAPGASGGSLDHPYVLYFTTGSAFTGHTVSGTVHAGTTGINPLNTLVALSINSITQGDPRFVMGTLADAAGNFSIPYVPDGTWYPLCAYDVNHDGNIDPTGGDAIGYTDPVTVNGANVSAVEMTLMKLGTIGYYDAVHYADSLKSLFLSPSYTLRRMQTWSVDTLGHVGEWAFFYLNGDTCWQIVIRQPFPEVMLSDSLNTYWTSQMLPITNPELAGNPDSVFARAERLGGWDFRHQSVPDSLTLQITLDLGQLYRWNYWPLITDTAGLYWGIDYNYGYQPSPNTWQTVLDKRFLANFSTAEIIGYTGVHGGEQPAVREGYQLSQNWPNPFNPMTTISYQLAATGHVTLTVYDQLGRVVASLVNGVQTAGAHQVRWNAENAPSGVYFYRLTSGTYSDVRKLVLIR